MKKCSFLLIMLVSCISLVAQETSESLDARRRAFINNFLKTYEAAYEKKEIDYIATFFSDNALMITETMKLQRVGQETIPGVKKSRPYESVVEDRKKYIDRLREIFNSNTSIHLSLAINNIVRHDKYPEIYGVNLYQIWKDQNGGDNLEDQMPGYIFLMVDFKKSESTPIIHVRTWQPKANIKTPMDKYRLRDFMIYETK